ncbi:MAG: AN1-type zinc finger domain-containing protein [Crenarchaeota archaeon]|nr:AN1-type zinc finger domain-containing protein [Thermoproteota archaeon]
MLQRCHVCGRTDENYKPCPLCEWVFCEKHSDPEEHDCISLKKLKTTRPRLEHRETLLPVSRPAESAEGFLANVTRVPKESVLDENLSRGLNMLGWMLPLYIVGSPLAGTFILMFATGFITLIGIPIPREFLTLVLSVWFEFQSFPMEFTLLATPILMVFLLAVGGGLMVLAIEYGLLLPAFGSLRKHDESFRHPLTLVKIGCTGPVILLIAIIILATEISSQKPVSTTTIILFWTGAALLVIGQIGLVAGLFKLGGKLENPRFSAAAAMFIINLLLSLLLSPLAIIAGFAGWAITLAASRASLKKR